MVKRAWRKKDILRQSLLGLARSLGAGKRMPTVAALCDSLSVSNSTLDPILRELEKQGAIVREHGRGIFVSPTIHCKTIGVVFGGDIFSAHYSPFWSLLLGAVRSQAGASQFQPRAYLDISEQRGAEGHVQLIEDIAERRLDGLLLFMPQYHYDEAAELHAYGLPLVVFGDKAPEYGSVTFDWDGFIALAAQELARSDCRRVGLLASPEQQTAIAEAFRDVGLDDIRLDDWSYETWAAIIPGAGTRENCACQLTRRMIAVADGTPLPDVLISLEDTATRGVITALREAGLHPGRDVRVVTAENQGSPVLEPFAADLVRIPFDPAECVAAMLAMLKTLIDGGTPARNPVAIEPHPALAGPGARGKNSAAQ